MRAHITITTLSEGITCLHNHCINLMQIALYWTLITTLLQLTASRATTLWLKQTTLFLQCTLLRLSFPSYLLPLLPPSQFQTCSSQSLYHQQSTWVQRSQQSAPYPTSHKPLWRLETLWVPITSHTATWHQRGAHFIAEVWLLLTQHNKVCLHLY